MSRIKQFTERRGGSTMGCAECHDHKFDPVSQKDYYRFFAFFNSLDANAMDGNKKDHAPVLRVPSIEQEKQLDVLLDP